MALFSCELHDICEYLCNGKPKKKKYLTLSDGKNSHKILIPEEGRFRVSLNGGLILVEIGEEGGEASGQG